MHLSLSVLSTLALLGFTRMTTTEIDKDNSVVSFIGKKSQVETFIRVQGYNPGNIVDIGHDAAQAADKDDIQFHVLIVASDTKVDINDSHILAAADQKKDGFDYATYVAASATDDGKLVYAIGHNQNDFSIENPLVQYADGILATLMLDDDGWAKNADSQTNVVLFKGNVGIRQVVLMTAKDNTDDNYGYKPLRGAFTVDTTDGFVRNGGLIQAGKGSNEVAYVTADELHKFVMGDADELSWKRELVMDGDNDFKTIELSTDMGDSLILSGRTSDGKVIGIPVNFDDGKLVLQYAQIISDMPSIALTRIAQDGDVTLGMGRQIGDDDSFGQLRILRSTPDTGVQADQASTGAWMGLQTWAKSQTLAAQAS